MKRNSQKIGKDFEKRFVKWLSNEGLWVHFINPAPDGSQPFDVIAVKGFADGQNIVYAFDCKTLDGKRFPLDRIEYNQELAFNLLNNHGIMNTYFAIYCNKNSSIYIIPSRLLIELKTKGACSINLEDYEYYCIKQNFN